MDTRRISEEYTEIGNRVIDMMPQLHYLREADVQIIFLASGHKKKRGDKTVYGQCEKIADKYKWGIPCEFTITVFEPNVEGFTQKQMEILLFHELLHVGVDGERHFVKPHDLEDFKLIIDLYGTDWARVKPVTPDK